MKFGICYDSAIHVDKKTEGDTLVTTVSPAEDAAHAQMKQNWLNSSATEIMVKKLHLQIDNLVAQSILQAITYPSHGNHQQIIQNLIRVSELQKTLAEIEKI